jgi:Resolvase, N terminal domain
VRALVTLFHPCLESAWSARPGSGPGPVRQGAAYHYLLNEEFESHGCKIRALNDRGDDSPEGQLTDGILDQLAKFERAKTAERKRRGKMRKAREGKIVAPRKVT